MPNYPQVSYGYANYAQQHPQYVVAPAQKSWIAALLLCFFFGGFGVHNFYTGHVGRGIVQLSLCILGWATVWIVGLGLILLIPLYLWLFIEFVLLLVGGGGYGRDASGIPLHK